MAKQTKSQKQHKIKKSIREHNRSETDPRYSKMTFGRYRGYYMKDIPYEYLSWCVTTFDEKNPLTEFLSRELIRRPQYRLEGVKITKKHK